MDNDYIPVPLPNRIEDTDVLLDQLGLAGAILTGGNDLAHLSGAVNTAPERDEFERRLLRCCTARSIPVFGVCRGFQMLVSFHGGTVVPVENHRARPHAIVAFSSPDLPLTDREQVNSFHNYGVRADGIPEDLRVFATAPDGTVEAVGHRLLPQWAVMWHPERMPQDPRDAALMLNLFRGRRQ
jgi:putative glutamine amidotransferase